VYAGCQLHIKNRGGNFFSLTFRWCDFQQKRKRVAT